MRMSNGSIMFPPRMTIRSTSKPEEAYKPYLFTTVRAKILRVHPGGALKNHVSEVPDGTVPRILFFLKMCETSRTSLQNTLKLLKLIYYFCNFCNNFLWNFFSRLRR